MVNPPHIGSFVEMVTEPGERPLFSVTTGEHFDGVFIQVSYETFITKHFQEWLNCCVMTRVTPDCDAVRIAITNKVCN